MKLNLPDERMMQAMQPYVRRALPIEHEEARIAVRGGRRTALVLSARNIRNRLLRNDKLRDHAKVARIYEESYATGVAPLDDVFAPNATAKTYRFGRDQVLMMPSAGLFSAYLEAFGAAFSALAPRSVCEVGFGTGKNLFYLAPRFPNIAFSGYELTQSGLDIALQIQRGAALPPNLARWIGRSDTASLEALRRIKFERGNAAELPASDKSFDMSITILALEQMSDILPKALSEIRRITRRYVVFLEPFRDANDLYGYMLLWSSGYFHASKKEVEAAGFRPIAMVTNLPNKLTFCSAMLVAEVL